MSNRMDVQSKLCNLLRQPPEPYFKCRRLFRHVGHWILNEANSQSCSIEAVIEDFYRVGCQSGYVSHLIYHCDTKRFYIHFLDEIHELLDEWEESTGESVKIDGLRTTTYAWFGFEYMVGMIQAMLEEEHP